MWPATYDHLDPMDRHAMREHMIREMAEKELR